MCDKLEMRHKADNYEIIYCFADTNLRKIEGIFLRLSTDSAYLNLRKPSSGFLRLALNH